VARRDMTYLLGRFAFERGRKWINSMRQAQVSGARR